MNEGQNQFFQYIMDCAKEGKEEDVKGLLAESFAKQADGSFSMDYLNLFHEKITTMLKEEKVEEVMNIMNQFGAQHVSK